MQTQENQQVCKEKPDIDFCKGLFVGKLYSCWYTSVDNITTNLTFCFLQNLAMENINQLFIYLYILETMRTGFLH